MGNDVAALLGSEELHRKFRQLGDELAGKNLELALVSGGLLIQNRAKTISPYITGNLRRSIHIGGHADLGGLEGDTTGTDIGGNKHDANGAEIWIGTNVEYAPPVEERKPFLRPAFDELQDKAIAEAGEALKALLRRVAP